MKKLILASTALAVAAMATPISAEIFEYELGEAEIYNGLANGKPTLRINNVTGEFSLTGSRNADFRGVAPDLKKWTKDSFNAPRGSGEFRLTGTGTYLGKKTTLIKIIPGLFAKGPYTWSDAGDRIWNPRFSSTSGGSTSSTSTSTGGSTSSTSTGGSTSSTSTSSTSSTSTGGSTSSTSTGSSTSTSSTSTSSGGSTSSSSGGQVPAPGALLLFGLGAAGLIGGRKLAKKK